MRAGAHGHDVPMSVSYRTSQPAQHQALNDEPALMPPKRAGRGSGAQYGPECDSFVMDTAVEIGKHERAGHQGCEHSCSTDYSRTKISPHSLSEATLHLPSRGCSPI